MNIAYVQCDIRYNEFLLDNILNKSVIKYVIDKLMRCKYIDSIIINLYTCEENDRIKSELSVYNKKVVVLNSSIEDVNLRLVEFARSAKCDYIVRVAGDQVFLNEQKLEDLLKEMQEKDYEWYYPDYNEGTLVDIVKRCTLEKYQDLIVKRDRYYKAFLDISGLKRMKYNHIPLSWKLYANNSFIVEVFKYTIINGIDVNYLFEKITNSMCSKQSYLYTSGWLKSIISERLVALDGSIRPWLTYGAIEFIESRINKDMIVFEYGSGSSTLWWANMVRKVVSVEHSREWFEKVNESIPNNITLYFQELIYGGEYCKIVAKYENKFDIILIDGRDRVNCVKNCLHALKAGGIIVWDDTGREQYEEGYKFLEEHKFRRLDFNGLGPNAYGSRTTVFYRTNNVLGI